MIEFTRFSLAFGVTIYAAWRTWRQPLLFAYFSANILYEIASEWPLLTGGDTSTSYLIVYGVCTSLWLLTALGIVWEATIGYTYRLRRFSLFVLMAVTLTRFVEVGIHRQMNAADWVVLYEGCISYLCGFTLVCLSFFSGRRADAYFILGNLWILLAGFKWAWLLALPEAAWIEAGWIVPTAFVVAGFLGVALTVPRTQNGRGLGDSSNRLPT